MSELFMTTHTADGAQIPIRKLTAEQLDTLLKELREQFDNAQAEFIDLLNRQFTLSRFTAAIEFEQERRKSIGSNA